MDLNLMDPKVVVLVAAVVILITAVFAWLATSVPNVKQVVNNLQVKNQKASSSQ